MNYTRCRQLQTTSNERDPLQSGRGWVRFDYRQIEDEIAREERTDEASIAGEVGYDILRSAKAVAGDE